MRILIILSLLCFCIYRLTRNSTSETKRGIVFLNGTAPVGRTDDHFICATLDWWPPHKCDYGTCSWGQASLLNLDLNNPILINAIKAFSPLKIRLGGTLQDILIYETKQNRQFCSPFVRDNSALFGFSQGCLPMSRWDDLNILFNTTGAVVTFGLNALNGKIIDSQGFATGAWNPNNAEALIRYTVDKGYRIHGWELGNELSGKGIKARIAADQYASDVKILHKLVQTIYEGFKVKPLVLAPGGFFDANWFTNFIDKSPNSLQVVTHHIYNLGAGNDQHLIDRILDPSLLSSVSDTFKNLQKILKNSGSSAVAWVGEAGGAHNSGQNRVSNAFVSSFWYLDQLGMTASYDTKTYCRQTLIGGNYGLLNTNTFVPNPDYYSALLWHRLMGKIALSTSFSGAAKMRAYAHCSKKTEGITLLLINLEKKTTVQITVSTESDGSKDWNFQQETENPTAKSATTSQGSRRSGTNIREEYHLTATDRDLQSRTLLLNGKRLGVDSSGAIPPLEPIHKKLLDPITVAPFSIVFVHFPNIKVPACL
ncbi:hypothetical protein UlMin_035965 [Ulmus minor]